MARKRKAPVFGAAQHMSVPTWTIALAIVGIMAGMAFVAWTYMAPAAPAPAPVVVQIVGAEARSAPVLRNDARDLKPNVLPSYAPADYQQVGLLTSDEADKDPLMLPLYGRRHRRDRWQYYAAGDKPTHLWRLPLSVNKRDCTEDIGCNEIYNGDMIEVPVYKDRLFTAHMYRLNTQTYDNRPPSF
jgi:hypothetical protein